MTGRFGSITEISGSYELPCFCQFSLGCGNSKDLGMPEDQNRETWSSTPWRQVCREHQPYSYLRPTGRISVHHPTSGLCPCNRISDANSRGNGGSVLTDKAGCHMQSSHTEKPVQDKAHVPHFLIPPLMAGHITIPYLL